MGFELHQDTPIHNKQRRVYEDRNDPQDPGQDWQEYVITKDTDYACDPRMYWCRHTNRMRLHSYMMLHMIQADTRRRYARSRLDLAEYLHKITGSQPPWLQQAQQDHAQAKAAYIESLTHRHKQHKTHQTH